MALELCQADFPVLLDWWIFTHAKNALVHHQIPWIPRNRAGREMNGVQLSTIGVEMDVKAVHLSLQNLNCRPFLLVQKGIYH